MRTVVVVLGLVVGWWWFHRSPAARAQADQRQAAVLADGFAVRHGASVQLLEHDGRRRTTHALPDERAARIFGVGSTIAAAWLKNGQLQMFDVKNNEVIAAYGRAAQVLCDGVATNDARFAVAWRETDGGLWFLHGPTTAAAASVSLPIQVTGDAHAWCGVASAEALITLLWRDRDWLRINWCTAKSCSPLPSSTKLARTAEILGFGCLRDACLVAVRDGGSASLWYVTESGSVRWKQPLPNEARNVAIVGVADRSFAVALPESVVRVERDGKRANLWRGSGTPVLAWSRGRLLVSHGSSETVLEVAR
jgi:hypothetical protein